MACAVAAAPPFRTASSSRGSRLGDGLAWRSPYGQKGAFRASKRKGRVRGCWRRLGARAGVEPRPKSASQRPDLAWDGAGSGHLEPPRAASSRLRPPQRLSDHPFSPHFCPRADQREPPCHAPPTAPVRTSTRGIVAARIDSPSADLKGPSRCAYLGGTPARTTTASARRSRSSDGWTPASPGPRSGTNTFGARRRPGPQLCSL